MLKNRSKTTVTELIGRASNKNITPYGAGTQEVFDMIGIHLGNTNICVSYAIRD